MSKVYEYTFQFHTLTDSVQLKNARVFNHYNDTINTETKRLTYTGTNRCLTCACNKYPLYTDAYKTLLIQTLVMQRRLQTMINDSTKAMCEEHPAELSR